MGNEKRSSKIKIAILGSTGFVGSFVSQALKEDKFELETPKLDITNKSELTAWISKTNSEIIINCVAYTNVDQAEIERDLAYRINTVEVKNLAELSKKV